MAGAASVQPDTKDRILDAAERLFGERGVAGTSLRAVTSEAGVNVAAVHYHFGSKDDLLRAVVTRRAEPVNRERLERLARAEARAAPAPAPLEEVLDAFFRPPLRVWVEGGRDAVPSFALHEPVERIGALMHEVMAEVAERFRAALGRALPQLPPEQVAERLQVLVAVLIHVLSGWMHLGQHGVPARDLDGTVAMLRHVLAAGLRAPAFPPSPREPA